jgi:formylglycine-generating enzyme required for sulfatase activity
VPASDRGGNEYALRAGSVTRYPWGDSPGEGEANCDGCGSREDLGQTAPVGSFQPNAFGLYDMQGNVWEWVEDAWHGNYDGALRTGRDGFKATQTAGSSAAVLAQRYFGRSRRHPGHVRFNTRVPVPTWRFRELEARIVIAFSRASVYDGVLGLVPTPRQGRSRPALP